MIVAIYVDALAIIGSNANFGFEKTIDRYIWN